MAPGAPLELRDVSIVLGDGASAPALATHARASLRLAEGGRLRLEGSGALEDGGRLGGDVRVDPATLEVTGRVDLSRVRFDRLTPWLPELPWHRPDETTVSGRVRVEERADRRLHLEGRVDVEGLSLAHRRIAPQPVRGIDVGLEGTADWSTRERRLDVRALSISLGDARVSVEGAIEWPDDHYLVALRTTLPATDCDAAVGAIPGDLLGELRGFDLSGQLAGRVDVRVDSRDLGATALTFDIDDGCRFDRVPPLADTSRFRGPFTHRIVEPDGSTFEMETGPGTPNWTPLGRIPRHVARAVLNHEDGTFFSHHGFADFAIRAALVRNLREGRFVQGGSTLTMQLVKNVFLRREKTLARKVQEVLLTWWVESAMSKEEILELYLNVVEFGRGAYGIRNGARYQFGRSPGSLSPAQSAYLALILPAPKRFNARRLGEGTRRRLIEFVELLGSRGSYTPEQVAGALAQIESGLRAPLAASAGSAGGG
jgi:hypothetical protein